MAAIIWPCLRGRAIFETPLRTDQTYHAHPAKTMIRAVGGYIVKINDLLAFTANELGVNHEAYEINAVRTVERWIRRNHPHFRAHRVRPFPGGPDEQGEPTVRYIIPTGQKRLSDQDLRKGFEFAPDNKLAVYVKEEGIRIGYPPEFFKEYVTLYNPNIL